MFLAETSIQLVPDGTMLVHLIVVVVMVAILNRTLLNPINRILAEREKQIKANLIEAEQLESARLDRVNQYNSTLRDARTDGYRLLERERTEGMKQKDEQVRQAKLEIRERVAGELDTVRKEEDRTRRELEAVAVTVSEDISARVFSGPR